MLADNGSIGISCRFLGSVRVGWILFLYKNTWMWCNWQHIGLPIRRCRIITGYPLSEGEGRHFLTSGQTIKYSRRPQARSSAPWAGSRNGVTLVLHTRDGGFDSRAVH